MAEHEQYIPTVEDVRDVWVTHEEQCVWGPPQGKPAAQFDRWLTAHDARVCREAGRDALSEALAVLGADDVQRQWPNECWDGIWAAINAIEFYRDSSYPEQAR